MKQVVSGILILVFLVTMAVMRWGPGMMSSNYRDRNGFDRRGQTATIQTDGDIFADVARPAGPGS